MKKRTSEIPTKEKVYYFDFCTECENTLVNFGINSKKINNDLLRKRFEKCKATGKFKGNFCARLFIANFEIPEDEFLETDL